MAFPNTTVIPIQFSGGLNSKISEFSLDQPYLQEAKNAVFNQTGQIDKRNGFSAFSTNIQGGGNIDAGFQLTTFNDELLLFNGSQLYSWQDEENVWIPRGAVFSTVNDQIRVLNTKGSNQSNPDCTSFNNLTLYVWEDNRSFPKKAAGIRYSVINNDTKTIIVSDQQLYQAGARPKVVCDGNNFTVFYVADINNILSATIPVNAANTVSSNLQYAAQDGYSDNQNAPGIAYDAILQDGLPLLVYNGQHGVKTNIATTNLSSETDILVIAACIDSNNNLWICYSTHTDTYVSAWSYDGLNWNNVVPKLVLESLTPRVSQNIAIIEDLQKGSVNITIELVLSGAENINNNVCNNYIVSSAGKSTFIGQMRNVGLASKPYRFGDNIFINTIVQANLQATYFTQCLTQGLAYVPGTVNIQAANNTTLATNFALVSKHSPSNGGTYRTNRMLSQCDPVSDGVYIFAGQRKGPFTSFQNSINSNLGCAGYSVQFNAPDAFNNVSVNNNLHIVGGIKKIYDGVSCVEDNFNLFPEDYQGYGCEVMNSTLTVDGYYLINNNSYTFQGVTYSANGGGLTYTPLVQNQYQWLVVYEWTDNAGNVQRSKPSIPFTATTSQTNYGVILKGPMLRLTEKIQSRSPVIVSIYRTQDNLPIFYKVTNDNAPIINDPTQDFWVFVDLLSDAQIATDENLYTGSQLPNNAPPPCSLISLYQQRLMINNTEDPGTLWFSQNKFDQTQYNTLALDWNTDFVEGIDSRLGNKITAIGLLDNTLAIFKPSSIFILSGDGPNSFDTAGQFSDAALLVSDVGCTNQNSLCFITQTPKLPGGLMFKSAKGIYLLGRDETCYYIGAQVEKYNNLTITSANLLTTSNQVVFTTVEGTCLVYNYFFDAWTTWEGLPAINATVWKDHLCILRPDGTVMMQQDGVFKDTFNDGVVKPVELSITTPWIKLNGLQGYQSVFACYLLGTLQGPHILSVNVSYDYNPSNEGNVLINSNLAANRWGSLPIWGSQGVWGNHGQFSNYQFQINMNNPRCQSIQITVSDVNNTTFSQGFSLNSLVLECITHQGAMRLPVQNKVGII